MSAVCLLISAGGASSSSSSAMRLGIKLEQRSDVRRLVDVLTRRLRQAGDDLTAAVSEVTALQAANAQLSEALVEAREELTGQPGGRIEQQLAAVSVGMSSCEPMHACTCLLACLFLAVLLTQISVAWTDSDSLSFG